MSADKQAQIDAAAKKFNAFLKTSLENKDDVSSSLTMTEGKEFGTGGGGGVAKLFDQFKSMKSEYEKLMTKFHNEDYDDSESITISKS